MPKVKKYLYVSRLFLVRSLISVTSFVLSKIRRDRFLLIQPASKMGVVLISS